MNRKNKNWTKHELNCNQKHKPCTLPAFFVSEVKWPLLFNFRNKPTCISYDINCIKLWPVLFWNYRQFSCPKYKKNRSRGQWSRSRVAEIQTHVKFTITQFPNKSGLRHVLITCSSVLMETDTQSERQTDTQTHRQTDTQTDRQTHRQKLVKQ